MWFSVYIEPAAWHGALDKQRGKPSLGKTRVSYLPNSSFASLNLNLFDKNIKQKFQFLDLLKYIFISPPIGKSESAVLRHTKARLGSCSTREGFTHAPHHRVGTGWAGIPRNPVALSPRCNASPLLLPHALGGFLGLHPRVMGLHRVS